MGESVAGRWSDRSTNEKASAGPEPDSHADRRQTDSAFPHLRALVESICEACGRADRSTDEALIAEQGVGCTQIAGSCAQTVGMPGKRDRTRSRSPITGATARGVEWWRWNAVTGACCP